MKLTETQKAALQNYLHDTLSYRETYEEIYDHILSAMEFQPEGTLFEDAINNIIRDDFGGVKNLVKIEKASKDALVTQGFKKYLHFVGLYFRFPYLLYTISASALTYYLLSVMPINALKAEFALVVLTMLAPFVIYMARLYNTGYILDTTRKSARDKMFENLAGGPVRVFVLLNIWIAKTSAFNEWFSSHPYIVTMILLACTVYNLALYRLYKDEFKMVTTK